MSTDLDTLWEQLSVLHYRAGEYGDDWIEDGRSLAAAVLEARAAEGSIDMYMYRCQA